MRRIGILAGLFGALVVMQLSREAVAAEPMRRIESSKRTQVVATLDTPIETGKNAVWCASFVAAWKKLQHDLAGGTVSLDGAREASTKLDESPDPNKDLPGSALYAVGGFAESGILDTIRDEVAKRFPNSERPSLPRLAPGGFIAYARLEVAAKFPVPYSNTFYPMNWTSGSGQNTEVRGFGVPNAFGDVARRAQPRVFHSRVEPSTRTHHFVLDLNASSQPTQVIVAHVPRKATLSDTLIDIAQRCADQRGQFGAEGTMLHEESTLNVPEMAWRLVHSFNDLAGRTFVSGPLIGKRLDIATQEIELRLDQNGAEVKSEALLASGGAPKAPYFYVYGPFLLMMWQRGAERPFFVTWVENDELLTPFKK